MVSRLGVPPSAESGAGPSLDNSPAKKPFSQDRCASENGALAGMISILGGGDIWFMRKPRRPRACAMFRHRGVVQRSGMFRQATRDAAFFADRVEFARVAKDDLRSVCRRETEEPRRVRQFLRRSRASRQETGRD